MLRSSLSVVIAAAIGVSLAVPAFSAPAPGQSECACQSLLPAGAAGGIISSRGQVLVSQEAGYTPAVAGAELAVGSRIVVGAKSEAAIRVGSCKLTLAANSDAEIARKGKAICVRMTDPISTASIGPMTSYSGQSDIRFRSWNKPSLYGILFALAGLAFVVFDHHHDHDNPVSRQ